MQPTNNDFRSIPRSIAWAMWSVGAVFYAYQYILRVMPSIMMNDIMQQFAIDLTTFGQFSGVYYLSYALMHLPLGILLDRYGPKRIVPLCILLTVLGLLPMLFATHWVWQIVGRLLIGMGSSGAILSTFKIIRIGFSEDKFTRLLSFAVTVGLIGAIYGGGPVNYMCNVMGYKGVVIVFAGVGIALCAVAYMLIPNINMQTTSSSVMNDIKEVFRCKEVMLVCILGGLMIGPLEGFSDVWGKEFLQHAYGFDSTVAASLPSVIFIAMCFGAPILSYIAVKTKDDVLTIFGAGLLMAISFILLLFADLNASVISLVFSIIGVCCGYQTIVIYKASTYVREGLLGLTTAVANMIMMLFGYAFHSIIGLVVSLCQDRTPAEAFTYGIAAVPAALCIGAVGFLFIYWREGQGELAVNNLPSH